MDAFLASSCQPVVCHCLGVTEAQVIEALEAGQIETIKDMRCHTGAGDGCTACHFHLKKLIQAHRCQTPV